MGVFLTTEMHYSFTIPKSGGALVHANWIDILYNVNGLPEAFIKIFERDS